MTGALIYVGKIIFWSCFACIALSYAGYPLLLAVWPFRRKHRACDELPVVSLVISAYHEAKVIAKKVENSLAIDYPPERLEIIVISDGSEDGTDEIVSRYAGRGVMLCRQEPRAGKSTGLTRFVPEARGDIVLFSDANSMYSPDALRQLVRHFADPEVGYVVGQQRYVADLSAVSVAESLYWRYEAWVKSRESDFGSVVGGDGAIYAIRSELFEPLREDDISDFTLPLRIVARGYRGVYEPAAVCHEETAASFRGEFRRKARIVNRSLRAVLRVPAVMNPFRVGIFSIQLLLHKLLRWFVPFFLCGMLVGSMVAAVNGEQLYAGAVAAQLVLYATALLRFVPWWSRRKLVFLAWYFCVVNAAAAVGILQQLLGKRVAMWTPERGGEPEVARDYLMTEATKSG